MHHPTHQQVKEAAHVSPIMPDQPNELVTISPNPEPVGFYCDHSDEPLGARTHHGWEWDEVNGGHTFQHMPNTISSHTGPDQAYLKPEDRERRCPRALPVYAVDAPALLARIAELETANAATEPRVREAVAQDFIRQGKASDSLTWGHAVYIARDGLCGCSGGIKPCDMGGAR